MVYVAVKLLMCPAHSVGWGKAPVGGEGQCSEEPGREMQGWVNNAGLHEKAYGNPVKNEKLKRNCVSYTCFKGQ